MKLPWMKKPEAGSDDDLGIHGDVASLTMLEDGARRLKRSLTVEEERGQSSERDISAARSVL